MLRDIVIHGALGKRFGRKFTLDVAKPTEAVRALVVQIPGFRAAFENGFYKVIRGSRKLGRALSLDELDIRLGSATEIHIVPVIGGAGRGLGKVLAGLAIVALAIAAPYALGLTGGLSSSVLGGATIFGQTITFGQFATIGLGIVAGGIAQMVAPSPTVQGGSASVDRRESFLFGGIDNTSEQGKPVPLAFGEFLVGSVVIAAGLDVEQI